MYPEVQLFIDGAWTPSASGKTLEVLNPATGEVLGKLAHAGTADLDRALAAAEKGFHVWRKVSAHERAKVMRKASALMKERVDTIAPLMTMEQGKPLAQAKGELIVASEVIEWFAEEARRTYGRGHPGPRRGRLPARASRSRSARSPRSRRGISRSIRPCASCPPDSPPAARSS